MLKFWCREPPGSKLEQLSSESNQENPPNYYHGPLAADTHIAPVRNPATTPAQIMSSGSGNFLKQGGMGQRSSGGGGRDYYRERRPDGNRKRPRDFNNDRTNY